jgi:hypothetical protein
MFLWNQCNIAGMWGEWSYWYYFQYLECCMVLFGVIVRKCVGYSMHLDIAGGSPEWISTCFKGRGWFEGGS